MIYINRLSNVTITESEYNLFKDTNPEEYSLYEPIPEEVVSEYNEKQEAREYPVYIWDETGVTVGSMLMPDPPEFHESLLFAFKEEKKILLKETDWVMSTDIADAYPTIYEEIKSWRNGLRNLKTSVTEQVVKDYIAEQPDGQRYNIFDLFPLSEEAHNFLEIPKSLRDL